MLFSVSSRSIVKKAIFGNEKMIIVKQTVNTAELENMSGVVGGTFSLGV